MSNMPVDQNYEALLKQSFVSLKKVQARLEAVERAKHEPIAIVGLGCRFPGGATDGESFWRLLCDKVDTVTEIDPERWDMNELYDPDIAARGKINTRWASFMAGVDQFDAAFFGISDREASCMDPQQRLLLEVTWEALEDAGQTRDRLSGSPTGVFMGTCNHDYIQLGSKDLLQIDAYASTGCAQSIMANRISYLFDFRGPSVAVDTACSSSLVAMHLACQSLRAGECTLAVAGGVNLVLSPESTISFSKFGMLSSDGRCKAFDATADGFVRGEGCGVLVLKRLEDAVNDGDRILALIRGTAINQDGRSAGLTAPNGLAQEAVIHKALDDAQLSAAQISYVEAHGTGTALGDPIEVEALSTLYGRPRADRQPCLLGSVKANIGHTEATAGVAGVIKVVQALRHEAIPGQIHLTELNPNISLEQTRFTIPTELTPWPAQPEPRRAGINSFSFGGANAHVIVEEAPRAAGAAAAGMDEPRAQLLPLSAHTPEGLRTLAQAYRDLLAAETPRAALADIGYTAAVRRSHHDYRAAVAGSSREELVERLDAFVAGEARTGLAAGRRVASQRHRIAFVFPGHGSQWAGMGRQLLATEPVFRDAIERCDAAIQRYGSWSLLELLTSPADARLEAVDVIQPAIFAIQVGLAALWRAWGVEPDAVVGHSMGEVAAAHVAGVLSLDDAARIICHRSRLIRRTSGQGAMAAVDLPVEQAEAAVAGYEERLVVALSNSPRSTVISGDPAALDEVLQTLERDDVFCRRVKSDVAFHSPQMDPLCPDLLEAVAPIQPRDGALPIYSTVDGAVREGARFVPDYWTRNLRQPVLFAGTVQQMLNDGYTTFVELSPHPILVPAIEQGIRHRGQDAIVLPSLRREQDERATMLASLGGLYARGHQIDWSRLYPAGGRCVRLPAYPWQRQSFWWPSRDAQTPSAAGARPRATVHPLLGRRVTSSLQPGITLWEVLFDTATYLQDHQVRGTVVVPATAYLEAVLGAIYHTYGPGAHIVEQAAFKQVLILRDGETRTVQLALTESAPDRLSYQVASRPSDAEDAALWTLHGAGTIRLAPGVTAAPPAPIQVAETQGRSTVRSGESFYQDIQQIGFDYGPTFRGAERIWFTDDEALAELRLAPAVTAELDRYHIHPALLDICFHVLASTRLHGDVRPAEGETYLPVGLQSLQIFNRSGAARWSHAQLLEDMAAHGDTLTGDVMLLDDDGHVLVVATGLTMQRLNRGAQADAASAVDEWLYHLAWEAQQLTPPAQQPIVPPARGSWLIFVDRAGAGLALANLLAARGERCVTAAPADTFAALGPDHYQIDPNRPADFGALLRDAFGADQPHCRGIVFMWSLEDQPAVTTTGAALQAAQERGCESVLHLVQAIAHVGWRSEPRLWLVTRGAQAVAEDAAVAFAQAPLWGLGRVIAHEHPGLRCTRIDLDATPQPDEVNSLFLECVADDSEDQIAIRQSTRYVARLARFTPQTEDATARHAGALRTQTPAYILDLEPRDAGIAITAYPGTRRPPAPDEVEVEVYAAAVDGQAAADGSQALRHGHIHAGVVVRTGDQVTGHTAGDPVIVYAPAELGAYVTRPADHVAPKPDELSFEQAAAITLDQIAVWYALRRAGRIERGERMLVDTDQPAIVLAATWLADQAGTTVVATAEDAAPIDVILHAGPEAHAPRSLVRLAPYGRFLDIGARRDGEPRAWAFGANQQNFSYTAIDVARMAEERPALFGALLRDATRTFAEGAFTQPAPRVVPLAGQPSAIVEAQPGSFVLALRDSRGSANGILPFRADGTYLITGGTGGLGLVVAEWMAARGARSLVLVSRSGSPAAASPAATAIDAMREAGVEVVVAAADVADQAQLARVIHDIDGALPPLRGIIHAAGVLDDGILLQLTRERFHATLAPKLHGSWNLHALTLNHPLDFFVMFSSAAALLGSPGQGNYAAANAALDALAHARHSSGRPALSINWGPWAEVGMAAQATQGIGGVAALSPEQGLAALERLLSQDAAQVGVMPINLRQWRQFYPKAAKAPLFARLMEDDEQARGARAGGEHIRAALLAVEPVQRRSILEAHLREQIVQVLRIAPSRVEEHTAIGSLGLDSLMALDLRNRLEDSLELTLPVTLIWNYQTIADLAPHLAEKMEIALDDAVDIPAGETAPVQLSDEESEDLARVLQELSELSIAG